MQTQTPKATTYEGMCKYCESIISRRQTITHGEKCSKKPKTGVGGFRLRITSEEWKNFWLIVEVNKKATFASLDTLLRKIWLECCGHLSQFGDWHQQEMSKSKKIVDVLKKGDKVMYIYDFGTETRVEIEVVKEIDDVPSGRIHCHLVARNLLPPIECACKKSNYPTRMCPECMRDDDSPVFYCDTCGPQHEQTEDHYLLPVANSPRAGECAYEQDYPIDELFPV